MKEPARLRLLLLLLLSAIVSSAQQAGLKAAHLDAQPLAWFSSRAVDFSALTPAPSASGSEQDKQDLAAVLLAQKTRSAAEVQQAQADDKQEDIFVFATVLGSQFRAAELPLTVALSLHLRQSSALVNPPLKLRFDRPRPFVASTKVHPVCQQTTTGSYPSGHAMVGTLEALALTQILPERAPEIFLRLDQYLHNRVVCGVHYPSDVAASRLIASSLFGLIAASPSFQKELASARVEVRNHLGLPARPADAAATRDSLANNTVLIVRHAEKPPESAADTGLTDTGQHRAQAYIRYFQPFQEDGMKLQITALYAGADSAGSIRPRLTLEPLSKASGLPLDSTVSTKDPAALLALLRSRPHGDTPLICWRHGQIPALLSAFGATPASLLPAGKWPDDTYDWVVVLHFDAAGHLQSQKLLHESLQVH